MTDELIAAMLAVAPDAAALDRLAELAGEEEEEEEEEEEVGESASSGHHPAVLAAMLQAAESEDWAAVDRLAAMTPGEVRAVIEGGAVAESYTAREYVGLLREYRAGLVLKAVGTGKNGKPVKRWVRAEPLPARDPNKPKRDVIADAKAAKAGREPGRQAAREAWRKAVSGGGGDPAELAAHLRLLTRDELREMNRSLANQLGGVKEDHVTRLLTHAGAVGPQQSPTVGVDKPPTVGNTTPVPPQSAGANTGGGGMSTTTAGEPHIVTGDTFKHKDAIKAAGGTWDADGKFWTVPAGAKLPAGVTTKPLSQTRVGLSRRHAGLVDVNGFTADAGSAKITRDEFSTHVHAGPSQDPDWRASESNKAISDAVAGGLMPSAAADELVRAGYSPAELVRGMKKLIADEYEDLPQSHTPERIARIKADAAAWLAKGGAA